MRPVRVLLNRRPRGNFVAASDGRAVLCFAIGSLLDWNNLVWHHLVYRVARVLDRVSELLLTPVRSSDVAS